jgi:hypothetical protein
MSCLTLGLIVLTEVPLLGPGLVGRPALRHQLLVLHTIWLVGKSLQVAVASDGG